MISNKGSHPVSYLVCLFETPTFVPVNGCTGKMGKAVAEAAVSAGLELVPVSFSGREKSGRTVQVGSTEIQIHGPSERENILSSMFEKFPNLVVVDYTVPDAVNGNAELYCKVGVPFVMGTTGGDREVLYRTVQDANVYAVISPQMGKQVMESHQVSKLDISGTAKAVISCFRKLGVSFSLDQDVDSCAWKKLDDPSWVKLQHDYKVAGESILALEEQRQVSGYTVGGTGNFLECVGSLWILLLFPKETAVRPSSLWTRSLGRLIASKSP
ncbi:hypothetical protein COCNU_09G004290 [Cocos nucifera]|uniref:Dihydrodipicolinate reductase N-terminal domain-containing protein n=1 Tax=Cocos nucifera TaxID=13894 RepID=A0A8K0IK54_COCNU|nr:hypothetical protein COCNU_09G004290 [Cocos nucifera]